MNSAFFYKEQKAVFVMASLAIWFALLALFGPYLPANAMAQHKRLAVNLDGQQITGEWTREKGRWMFRKVVGVKKIGQKSGFPKPAVASNRDVEGLHSMAKWRPLGPTLPASPWCAFLLRCRCRLLKTGAAHRLPQPQLR